MITFILMLTFRIFHVQIKNIIFIKTTYNIIIIISFITIKKQTKRITLDNENEHEKVVS